QGPAEPVSTNAGRQQWRTPTSLNELAEILHNERNQKIRLVHGNTSYGVYKPEYLDTTLFVDIRLIPELNYPIGARGKRDKEIVVAAGTTYNDLIELIAVEKKRGPETAALDALDLMARRTAGRIVRNAASLGGNTM